MYPPILRSSILHFGPLDLLHAARAKMTPHATGRRHRLQEGCGSTPYALLDTVQVWGLRETRRERLREGMIPQASTKNVLCGVSRCVRYGA